VVFYPAIVLFEQSNCIYCIIFFYKLYTVTDQNIAILVPDYFRATKRNNNSISVDMVEHDKNDPGFCFFHTIWKLIWTFGIAG